MPAETGREARFFRIVRAVQKGKRDFDGAPSAAARRAASSMTKEDVRKFMHTKRRG